MSHTDFKFRLAKSTITAWDLARQLNDDGYPIQVPVSRLAPTPAEWMHYTDNGDLFVTLRVEVKQSSLVFSCAEDYKHNEFMVCNKLSCDRAVPPPSAYLIVSADQKYIAVIRKQTRPQWYPKVKFDKGKNEEFYFCNKAVVEWWPYKQLMGLF